MFSLREQHLGEVRLRRHQAVARAQLVVVLVAGMLRVCGKDDRELYNRSIRMSDHRDDRIIGC
jgi:hypothetical protein